MSTLKQMKEFPGLFTGIIEHEVSKTKASIKWEGKPFSPEMWHQLLAFFQWSYDTTKSETQARFYYNKTLGKWAAYVHPQICGTGMTTKTLDIKETQDEVIARSILMGDSNPANWAYAGTAHHHCKASAFQSSVDLADEKNTDGIHITVGGMGENRYNLHERVYLSGNLVEHNLDWFWDIGDVLESVPAWARAVLPDNICDRLARGQMCVPAPAGTVFPDKWKENLIEKKSEQSGLVVRGSYQGGLGYSGEDYHSQWTKKPHNLDFDLRKARLEAIELGVEYGLAADEVFQTIGEFITEYSFFADLTDILYRHDVNITNLVDFMGEEIQRRAEKEIKTDPDVEKYINEGNGIPDYQGVKYGMLPED